MKKLSVFFCLVAHVSMAWSQEYDITKFGASSDSLIVQTATIQNLIDKAHATGGGTIVVPKGVYLTGALFFRPETKLVLRAENVTVNGALFIIK